MTPKARIDPRVLLKALLEAPTPDSAIYVDTHTGELIRISKSTAMPELVKFKARMDREPDRLIRVPPPTAEESYGDMAAFHLTVKDKKLQERLRVASTGGGTLRDFLDALAPQPAEKERWYRFREERTRGRLLAWMRASGLGV